MSHTVRKSFAVAAAASSLFFLAACSTDSSTATGATTSSNPVAAEASTTATTGEYVAGTYDAEGSYTNPGGSSEVEVELTIDAEGTITAVEVTPEATGGNSKQFQEQFAGGISDEVVGKKIDELSVSKVAGSSLTSAGFNDAVAQIIDEAKA